MIFPILAMVASLVAPAQQETRLLRVQVLESFETPAALTWTEEYRVNSWGAARWPQEPHLVVLPKRTGPLDAHLEGEALVGERACDGQFEYRVAAGREYWVGVYGGDVPFQPQVVQVGREGADLELSLHLERHPLAGLKMNSPIFSLHADSYTIEDAVTGVVLHCAGRWDWPGEMKLPEGRYRIHVADRADPGMCGSGSGINRRRMGRMTREVQLDAHRLTEVPVEIPPGGKLDLELVGSWQNDDLMAAEKEDEEGKEKPGRRPETVSVHLVPEVGAPILVSCATVWPSEPEDTPVAIAIHHVWVLNYRQKSEVLPIGDYTLVAQLPAGRVRTTTVQIREGETTRCRLRF